MIILGGGGCPLITHKKPHDTGVTRPLNAHEVPEWHILNILVGHVTGHLILSSHNNISKMSVCQVTISGGAS